MTRVRRSRAHIPPCPYHVLLQASCRGLRVYSSTNTDACIFVDKAEIQELYVSILTLDKIREPYSLGLGFTSCCSREQFPRESGTGAKRRRKRAEGFVLLTASIVRSHPLPRKGKDPVMNEAAPSSGPLSHLHRLSKVLLHLQRSLHCGEMDRGTFRRLLILKHLKEAREGGDLGNLFHLSVRSRGTKSLVL